MPPSPADNLDLVHVRPAFGGIHDYSEAVHRVLRSAHPGVRIQVLTVRSSSSPRSEGRRLAREIESLPGLVLADMGSGDRTIFWSLHHLRADRDYVLTVHDPGVFIHQLFRLPGLTGGPLPIRAAAQLFGRALDLAVARRLFRQVLARARARLVLNPSTRELWGSPLSYLPQPVYEPVPAVHRPPEPPRVAYAGYWSAAKGLDELLGAFEALLPRFPRARFVIAGESPSPGDRWAASFLARARRTSARIELPGFVASSEFDAFLRGLTALVLPYRAEIPGAGSAMLMRAQQAGVPLVVSDTPFLRAQVNPENVTIVPPRDAGALADALARVLSDPAPFEEKAAREQGRIYAEHGDAAVASVLGRLLACGPADSR